MRVIQTFVGLTGYRHQLDRVGRMLERLYVNTNDERAFADDFLSYCMHCAHLQEWLERDDVVPKAAKRKVGKSVATARWLPICRDLSNGHKHVVLDRPKSGRGAQVRYIERRQKLGEPEFSLDLILDDGHGNETSALVVALNSWDEWRQILKAAGLATKPQRP
jgi:hypothetical protein